MLTRLKWALRLKKERVKVYFNKLLDDEENGDLIYILNLPLDPSSWPY